MESYRILEQLGEGTCGTVYKALDLRTMEIVAVKKMKRSFRSLEEFLAIREIKILRMFDHPNVIKLKAAFQENDEVNLVFEHMNHNLYEIMRERESPFSEDEIRSFLVQVLHGLTHIHEKGCFHRDLKPENLLVTDGVLKVADFGLARETSSMPPYTEYVSTRWYRAPEVLLQSNTYTSAVDMWAVGAILAELFTLSPIFPGGSEIDQLYKICCVLGTPELPFFSQAINTSRLANLINYEKILPANMFALIPNACSEAIDLMTRLLSWDPSRRPTAAEALQHPFFHMAGARDDPLELTLSSMVPTGPTPNLELKLFDFEPEPEGCFLGLTLGVNPSVPKLADVVQDRNLVQDSLFNSGLDVHRETSDFWPLFSPSENGHFAPPVESSSFSQFCYGFPIHGEQSAFWPLISPETTTFFAPVQFPVLPTLYSTYYDSSIQCPAIIGSQSTGFPIPELQLNIPVSEDPFRLCPRHSREGRCL